MRRARLHPAFLVLFLMSFAGLAISVLLMLGAASSCNIDIEAKCVREGEVAQSASIAAAIGSLVVMVGAVGFQVGRNQPEPAGQPGPVSGPGWGGQPAGHVPPHQPFPQPPGRGPVTGSVPPSQPGPYSAG